VQPVDGAAALGGQLVAAIGEQPQQRAVVIGADGGEVVAVLGDDRDAARVDAVALAPVPALQHPDLGGQRRRDIDHGLAGSDQLLGQQAPEPAGAFDRPDTLRPAARPGEQAAECRAVRGQPQLAERFAAAVERGRGVRALVRVDADGDHGRCSLDADGCGTTPRRAT